jgi:hypothetical protein
LASTLQDSLMTRYGSSFRGSAVFTERLLARLSAGEALTVAELLESEAGEPRPLLLRSIVYLAKLDIVRVATGGGQ